MTLQRYKSSGHYSDGPCDNGEWVKAADADAALVEKEARIKRLELAIAALLLFVDDSCREQARKIAKGALEARG